MLDEGVQAPVLLAKFHEHPSCDLSDVCESTCVQSCIQSDQYGVFKRRSVAAAATSAPNVTPTSRTAVAEPPVKRSR